MKEIKVGAILFRLDLSLPLYEQVVEQIRSALAREEIPLGEKIPSVRELAQALQINPNTVMRAYQELDRDGLIETRRGQGTFITSSKERVMVVRETLVKQLIHDFIDKIESLGVTWDEVDRWVSENKESLNEAKEFFAREKGGMVE